MSNTSLLGSFGGQGDSSLMFRNVLINGNFSVWQRGTSQTATGYGSDDRWTNVHVGSTKTHSRQSFTLGQTDVPGNPQFFSRTVVSTVAGAGNFVAKIQRIEGVQTLAGQTATLSFWAKADAAKNIAIDFAQIFGTGGSPSATISGIGATTIALTTSWRYYTVTVSIPSISGKTIGTNGDDWIECVFWFDAGSNYNARANSLGQQSGTFDIAMVQLEAGPTATPFERRPIGVETALAQRYYYKVDMSQGTSVKNVSGFCIAGQNNATIFVAPPVTMRINADLSHNLADNQYVTSAPIGTQWSFIQDGNTFATKTGTAIFTPNGAGMVMYGASWNVTARPIFGPGVLLAYSAEL